MRYRYLFLIALLHTSACILGNGDCDHNLPQGSIGSCPTNYSDTGSYGAFCNDDGTCDPGLTCVSEQCLPCGQLGLACCGSTSLMGGSCTDGTNCAWGANDEWYTCQNCGVSGDPCCRDGVGNLFCVDGGTCASDGNCTGGGTSTACGTLYTYYVYAIDDTCAKIPFTLTADNDTQAKDCLAATLEIQFPGYQWGVPSQDPTVNAPTEQPVCPTDCDEFGTSGETVWLYSFTDDQLHACEQHKDSSCTWTDGECM